VNGLAGAGGGMIAQIITYPLQTVNTRQQTERKSKAGANRNLTDGVTAQPKAPAGTLHQICQVIKEEGWGGLYSGLMPSMVGTAASQGVYYYFYQIFRTRAEATALRHKKRGTGDGSVGMFSSLLSAAFSGCLNVLLTNPIWVVVTRMQTQAQAQKKKLEANVPEKDSESCDIKTVPVDSATKNKLFVPEKSKELGFKGIQPYRTDHAIKDLYKEAGIRGFWKGVVPTLIMVCNPSIQFMIYESLLQRHKAKRALNKEGLKNVTALEVFILGAIAKLGATVVTYPLLVVKSRLQAKQEIGGNKTMQYTGTLDAIFKMIRYEGLTGFYKGMSTKIVQSVFAAAVLFMIKEELVKAARTLVDNNRKIVRISSFKQT
ncbi:hypothetical protein KI387_014608, partial [Taxus chinensis]